MLTPYQFASNQPIWAIDLDGAEAKIIIYSPEQTQKLKKAFKAKDVKEILRVSYYSIANPFVDDAGNISDWAERKYSNVKFPGGNMAGSFEEDQNINGIEIYGLDDKAEGGKIVYLGRILMPKKEKSFMDKMEDYLNDAFADEDKQRDATKFEEFVLENFSQNEIRNLLENLPDSPNLPDSKSSVNTIKGPGYKGRYLDQKVEFDEDAGTYVGPHYDDTVTWNRLRGGGFVPGPPATNEEKEDYKNSNSPHVIKKTKP